MRATGWVVAALILISAGACGPSPAAVQQTVEAGIAQTQAALVTPTLAATNTPDTPPTSAATSTDLPATKSAATMTQRAKDRALTPTATRIPPTKTPPPTATPLPVVVTGKGDSVVDAENPYEVAMVHIVGNRASRHFSVTNYGPGNVEFDLLVNTTDPYDGYRVIDFGTNEHTVRFEVKATGAWTIEILSLSTAPIADGNISGENDGVFLVRGLPGKASIIGNSAGRYFGVECWGRDGWNDLLVNTTDPYNGTVLIKGDVILCAVRANGEWSFDFSK